VYVGPCDVVDTHRAAACRLTATQGASCAAAPVSRGMQILLWRSFLCGIKTTHWRLHEACLMFVAL